MNMDRFRVGSGMLGGSVLSHIYHVSVYGVRDSLSASFVFLSLFSLGFMFWSAWPLGDQEEV